MELLFHTARTTIDMSLNDWFDFTIAAPIMDLDAAPDGGARFPVEVKMDARIFARFHLDFGLGDVVMQPGNVVECEDWLAFAGISRPLVRMIPQEQQFAEKIHAYTLPRNTPNSRVKDLVDLALLVRAGELVPPIIRVALEATFVRRATHAVPPRLAPPPPDWRKQFAELSEVCLAGASMRDAFETDSAFYNSLAESEAQGALGRTS